MIISIITVTLNDIENLKRTFHSLKEQTCKDFEWIIKDGISNDDTEKFYHTEIKISGLKVHFIAEKDKSIYDGMNESLKYATGTYSLFLNSGDTLATSDTINTINKLTENYIDEFSFIYGDNIDITTEGVKIYKKARDLSYLRNSLPTSHQAIFYRTCVLEKFKYSLNYMIASDYALTAQIYYKGYNSYLKLEIPICNFYLDGLSKRNRKILLKEGFKIHREIIGDNLFIAYLKLIKRFFTFILLDKFPKCYRFLRIKLDKT